MSNIDTRVKAALKNDRQRRAEIRELGEKFGFPDDAEKFCEDGYTVEEFREFILSKPSEHFRQVMANTPQQPTAIDEETIEKIKAKRRA